MDLRLALVILGAVLILLVFGLSRYSDVFLRLRSKFGGQSTHRQSPPRKNNRGTRSAEHAPVLVNAGQDKDDNQDEFEDSLFHFNNDGSIDDAELLSNSHLIQDEYVAGPELESTHQDALEEDQEPDQDEQALTSPVTAEERESIKPAGPFTSLRQIDYWIKLSPHSPVTQKAILKNLSHWKKIIFPIQLHALTQLEPHWVNLIEVQGDTSITDVVASFQLLQSGSAATISDLNTFDEQLTLLGKALVAEKLMMATPEQALDQSLKLSRFFADNHKPLEVFIRAPEGRAFVGKLVETSAKQQGLDYRGGEYVRQKRMASNDVVLYRMCNVDDKGFDEDMSSDAEIRSVKFTMIPVLSRTPGRDAKEMLDAVKAFALRVRGEIRIPGETEFRPELLLKLHNRVSKIEKDTHAAGLEPGGQEICRIFS